MKMLVHTDECQLTCDHCPHGSACYKACCWCSAVRDGEGEPQTECTRKPAVHPLDVYADICRRAGYETNEESFAEFRKNYDVSHRPPEAIP